LFNPHGEKWQQATRQNKQIFVGCSKPITRHSQAISISVFSSHPAQLSCHGWADPIPPSRAWFSSKRARCSRCQHNGTRNVTAKRYKTQQSRKTYP
jgi:hypothetical protein